MNGDSSVPSKHKKPLVSYNDDGFYLSGKAVAYVVSLLMVGGGGVGIYRTFGFATDESVATAVTEGVVKGVATHDGSLQSHQVPGTDEGVVRVVANQQAALQQIGDRADKTDEKLDGVKVILVEFVADSTVKDAVRKNPRLSQTTRDRVRATVKDNLQADKPRQATAGIEPLVE